MPVIYDVRSDVTAAPCMLDKRTRYDFIQQLRAQEKWTVEDGVSPLNNFDDAFKKIRNRAGIDNGTFHDLRRTCLTNWFANGLSEYEVMLLAGHACFSTTHTFYLAVREDLLERGRAASTKAMEAISVANLLQQPSECHGLDKSGV
jgi:integrase